LSVSATGTGPFTYQWYKDDNAIVGANGASLQLPSVQQGDSGVYAVEVSNVFGALTSNTATVLVNTP
jgi:hypothetical protein